MNLWTHELAALTPPLFSTKDLPAEQKLITAKFNSIGSSGLTWYVAEAQEIRETGDVMFYGYSYDAVMPWTSSWSYFLLSQLQNLTWFDVRRVERDVSFQPQPFHALQLLSA